MFKPLRFDPEKRSQLININLHDSMKVFAFEMLGICSIKRRIIDHDTSPSRNDKCIRLKSFSIAM